jgi:thiosulfate dehydrogenase [quinone] large subunit
MENLEKLIGNPSNVRTPRSLYWLQRSKSAALIWNAMRIWLGVMWLQAGIAKIWGAENPAFMHNGGAGVAGFAGHGAAAYSWWATFLHSFVVPNAGWIGILVALAEFAIGIALAIGFLTPLACLGSLLLLFTYVMSGTASVCAFYALFAIVILAMWRTSSWIGVDGLISGYRQRHAAKVDESNLNDKSGPAPKVAPRGVVSPTNESFDPRKELVSVMSGTSSIG